MKTFTDYLALKETSAFDVGAGILGKQSLDGPAEGAITAAIQAFEIIMSKNSTAAIQFLNRMSSIPEVNDVLRNNNLKDFKDSDFKRNMRRGANKGFKAIQGLGDVSSDGEEIAQNTADSYYNDN